MGARANEPRREERAGREAYEARGGRCIGGRAHTVFRQHPPIRGLSSLQALSCA